MGDRNYERVPPHLRGYILVQDYSRYDHVDQQVWSYVVGRIFARLTVSAHPAYATGLKRGGISIDRIPSIDEMGERLGEFGWGAVCVDGFLPPRAFQEFQALGMLPINAEIRSPEHILYTPSPDIIHEAAGHAPILAEPRYAEYLRRIGRVGSRAFTSEDDGRVYQAIYELSELKDLPQATPADVTRAEERLARAVSSVREVSEAAQMSRLYWWTVEYGLVGRVDNYQLYGAGLLSSLGESASCHDPRVRKIPLSAACVGVDYDITREQPQLFVARDFDQLHDVLEEVAAGLAHRAGGDRALSAAQKSAEVATIQLDSGTQVTGRVAAVERDGTRAVLIEWSGRVGVGADDSLFEGWGADLPAGGIALLGMLADGTRTSTWSTESLAAAPADVAAGKKHPQRGMPEAGAPIDVRFRSGIVLRGAFAGCEQHRDGRLAMVRLSGGRVYWGERLVYQPASGQPLFWILGDEVVTAFAGAADPNYWPPNKPTFRRVPAPRPPRSAIASLDRTPTLPPMPGASPAPGSSGRR
jgi:phenylalanine-4-hydroxylase